MVSEEKMNADLKKQESFLKRKKKIIVISLSVAVILTTLIAGFLLAAKKSKERWLRHVTGLRPVVSHSIIHDIDENESDYLFEKTPVQITINVLLILVSGILFFFWENDKLPSSIANKVNEGCLKRILNFFIEPLCNFANTGLGLLEMVNWFGLATFGALIIITLLVEVIINRLLIGSISYLLSKDKKKKYLRTLEMSWKKRTRIFSSFSITKIRIIVLCYLLFGFVIALIARNVQKINPCCNKEIIKNHGANCCLGCGMLGANVNMNLLENIRGEDKKTEKNGTEILQQALN